jgi:hypothetical protein
VEMILFKFIKMLIKIPEFGVESFYKEKNMKNKENKDILSTLISKLEDLLNSEHTISNF